MKYAFYPGCVSRGACPELYVSTIEICRRLGIDLDTEVMNGASCTGAGVLQEKNQRLGDTLNASNASRSAPRASRQWTASWPFETGP